MLWPVYFAVQVDILLFE
jgi:hypothetical protein